MLRKGRDGFDAETLYRLRGNKLHDNRGWDRPKHRILLILAKRLNELDGPLGTCVGSIGGLT
jgi:hypothetical protein